MQKIKTVHYSTESTQELSETAAGWKKLFGKKPIYVSTNGEGEWELASEPYKINGHGTEEWGDWKKTTLKEFVGSLLVDDDD
jgi:hypothetical protein